MKRSTVKTDCETFGNEDCKTENDIFCKIILSIFFVLDVSRARYKQTE